VVVELDVSSIKIRSKRMKDKTQLRILIAYSMEREDNQDKIINPFIATHFIQMLTVTCNQKVVASCQIGDSVSKNPYFGFMLKAGNVGDKITVSWLDNFGNTDSEEHIVR
jgi:sulfur-oxidizing protein SoxZ